MSQPFVGQIILFGGNFTPAGWLTCNGQVVPISEFTALFQLLGTTYGGNGQTTFGIPDLQGRVPISQGTGLGLSTYILGQKAGSESITLTTAQLPQHQHTLMTAGVTGNLAKAAANTYLADEGSGASGGNAFVYGTGGAATQTTMSNGSIGLSGSSQPHENVQPVLAVTACIAAFGIFPSQN